MALKSIKYNFFLNLINTIAGVIFPIVTFPYVARILDPDGLGLISFYQSIINYVTIFSSLGIGLYAVREIARVKDDNIKRNRAAVEILLLHMSLTLLGYLVVAILCLSVERISAHESLFLVLSIPIFFNAIGVNWFYQAMEDFKYITLRSLTFKFLGAVALFIFVKNRNDVMNYAIILVLADVGNNIFNLIRLRKYIDRRNINHTELKIMRHLKPATIIFTLNIIISLYLGLSPIIIGFMVNDDAVGYFTATSKLTAATLSIVTALGTTLLPRMSYYLSHDDTEKFNSTAAKGLNLIIALSLPISAGLALTAPELILCFSGNEFTPAIPTMIIMAPTVLIIGIAGILGYQILYPMGHEKLIIKASLTGFIIYIATVFFLTPPFLQNGTAAAYALAELTVTTSFIIFCRSMFPYNYLNRSNISSIICTIGMSLSVFTIHHYTSLAPLPKLTIEIITGASIYALMMLILRHPLLAEIKTLFSKKIST